MHINKQLNNIAKKRKPAEFQVVKDLEDVIKNFSRTIEKSSNITAKKKHLFTKVLDYIEECYADLRCADEYRIDDIDEIEPRIKAGIKSKEDMSKAISFLRMAQLKHPIFYDDPYVMELETKLTAIKKSLKAWVKSDKKRCDAALKNFKNS